MGLLDDLLGGLPGDVGQQRGGRPPLGSTAAGGGTARIMLEQMERAGFGNQGRSWVGTGRNMPISPDAVGQIFGERGLEEVARHADLTPEQTSEGLSQLLPEVVDHITPGGHEPDADELVRSVKDLRRRMGV